MGNVSGVPRVNKHPGPFYLIERVINTTSSKAFESGLCVMQLHNLLHMFIP